MGRRIYQRPFRSARKNKKIGQSPSRLSYKFWIAAKDRAAMTGGHGGAALTDNDCIQTQETIGDGPCAVPVSLFRVVESLKSVYVIAQGLRVFRVCGLFALHCRADDFVQGY